MTAARFLVGIDLGTTHTVVAYADLASGARPAAIGVLPIEQLVSGRETERRPLLASCLYAPLAGEVTAGAAVLGWTAPPYVAGEFARRRGVEVPGRVITSAKSWLCHAGVDRTGPILPWGLSTPEGPEAAPESVRAPIPLLSPVEVSAQLLSHVRHAWADAFPAFPLEAQQIVLTVPASFDEAARELTLLATQRAGLAVRLLEEPQAAFYDWMTRAGEAGLAGLLRGGAASTVLICDVGGGTTDLSLLRVEPGDGRCRVSRVAVGDHLLLGGDNMDLALAHRCEPLLSGGPGSRLSPARFGQLVSSCRAAKEALLGEDPPETARVALLGEGSRLVGGAASCEVSRAEVEAMLLDGFFPFVPLDARPERSRAALVSFGLPYARDTAITRHLAWFLTRQAPPGGAAPLPDAIVLNGGVFHGQKVAERLAEVLGRWAGLPPRLLPYADPDLAVARGAVAYALALRGEGRRIEGGSPRGYYVGVGAGGSDAAETAVCVVPRGAESGARYRAPVRLALTIGRPARFELFASSDNVLHAPGDLVAMDEEHFHRLPPIATTLQAEGAAGDAVEVPVALEGELSEVGTLDLACVELDAPGDPRRFRLAFQLRRGPPSLRPSSLPPAPRSRPPPGGKRLDDATSLLLRVFGKGKEEASAREVKDLVRDLERLLGERASWTTELSRSLFDVVNWNPKARRRSLDHERVFWAVAGYTLRPGFGHPGDEGRVASLFPLFGESIVSGPEPRVWQQFWIAWRRVAGGLDAAQQADMRRQIDPHLAPAHLAAASGDRRRSKSPRPEALDELLALAAWLERVPPEARAALGAWIVERTWTDHDPRLWDAIGRIGSRVPAYASAHHALPASAAEGFLDELFRTKWKDMPTAPLAALRLARRTDDRARDVSERHRREVIKRLEAASVSPAWVRAVQEFVPVGEAEQQEAFGESLPVGLRLA